MSCRCRCERIRCDALDVAVGRASEEAVVPGAQGLDVALLDAHVPLMPRHRAAHVPLTDLQTTTT